MSSSGDSTGIDLSSVFAPIYWGFVVSLFLGGITVIQAWIYFPHPNDRLGIQVAAFTMLVFDLLSSGLVAQSIYYYLVPYFGATFQLSSVTPELSAECLLSGIMTFISQMYFVYQLYTVQQHMSSKVSRLLIACITLFALLAFAGGTSCVVMMIIFKHGVLANRNPRFALFFGLAKGFGTLTDIVATFAMCKFLTSSRTGIKSTDNLLKRLIQFVVERGLLVTLIQTLLLITFYAMPNQLVWFAVHVNVTKLYANTFFAMLNARSHLRENRYLSSSYTYNTTSQFTSKITDEQETYKQSPSVEQDQKAIPMHAMPTITKTVVVRDM